jgi:hypothetical protein
MGTHSGSCSPSFQISRENSRYQSIFMVKLIVVTQALKKLCNQSYRADYQLGAPETNRTSAPGSGGQLKNLNKSHG